MTNTKMLENWKTFMDNGNKDFALKVLKQLQNDVHVEEMKKNVKPGQAKIIKNIVDEGVKQHGEKWKGYSPYKNQFMYTNGCVAYILNSNLGYEQAEKTISERNVETNSQVSSCVQVDKANLKVFLAEHKKTRRPYVIQVNDKRYGFNPKFLADMLDYFGTTTLHLFDETFSIQLVKGENGEFGVICPIRVKDEEPNLIVKI